MTDVDAFHTDEPGWPGRHSKWLRPGQPLCPKARSDPDPCDCGYAGAWMTRGWYDPDEDDVGGIDEKCPQCGDVERFQWQPDGVRHTYDDGVHRQWPQRRLELTRSWRHPSAHVRTLHP